MLPDRQLGRCLQGALPALRAVSDHGRVDETASSAFDDRGLALLVLPLALIDAELLLLRRLLLIL